MKKHAQLVQRISRRLVQPARGIAAAARPLLAAEILKVTDPVAGGWIKSDKRSI